MTVDDQQFIRMRLTISIPNLSMYRVKVNGTADGFLNPLARIIDSEKRAHALALALSEK
jgi:hypothetical protein